MKFDYYNYFEKIKPKNDMEVYNRFIFSFCSVHTTWESNIKGYNLLKDNYHTNEKELRKIIENSGLGLHNTRTKGIHEFTMDFLGNPGRYMKRFYESWSKYASRLQSLIYGLGFAKTRFAIEMLYPNTAKVCCVDTHIIQWAKQNPNGMTKRLYQRIEHGWLQHSKKHNINPVEARWKWWDNKQGYDNPRYWSEVLENDVTKIS